MKRGYNQVSVASTSGRPFKSPYVASQFRGKYVPTSSRSNAKARYGSKLNRRGVASRETGYVDLAAAAYAADTTGSCTLIATVAQGASVNQRVGKKILWKSMQIRGQVITGATCTVAGAAYLVVYDKRPTGSLPAITDILVTANSNSFNNDANSGRFKILRRVDCELSGNSTTPATGNEVKDINLYLDLKGLNGVFKAAATGAIGDIEEGALYFVTVGDTAAGATAISIQAGFRTRFVDV